VPVISEIEKVSRDIRPCKTPPLSTEPVMDIARRGKEERRMI
jgi:hypothetical protein